MISGEPPKSLDALLDPQWNDRATMAKPVTGTTMTHAAALFTVWGEERTKAWLEKLQKSKIYWNRGNAQVMRDVGEGARAWGFTDTDDAYVSLVRKAPTATVVPDQGEGGLGTLVIPNSLSIMKGAKNLENAKKLVDFLLSPEVEKMLAESNSVQIPLHPGVAVPAHIMDISKVKAMPVDWEAVADALEKHGKFLNDTFEGQVSEPGKKSSAVFIALGVVFGIVVLVILGRRSAVR
jgi:iron(III) transport system substrate-binding protein